MRQLAMGFGCVWVLWSAQAGGAVSAPTPTWGVVAKLGGHAECAAYADSMKRTPSDPPVQYVCLPEGDQPPRR
jgi:hypothetical protein